MDPEHHPEAFAPLRSSAGQASSPSVCLNAASTARDKRRGDVPKVAERPAGFGESSLFLSYIGSAQEGSAGCVTVPGGW